jgi:hypothetical protein
MESKKFKGLDAAGWVRLGLYLVVTVASTVAFVARTFGREEVALGADQIPLLLGMLFGPVAASHVPKAPDQNRVDPARIEGEVREIHSDVREIRDRAVEAFPGVRVPEVPDLPPFSSYKGV